MTFIESSALSSSFAWRSCSYFSNENSIEKYSDEQNAKQFTDLVDVMEDVAERFGDSAYLSNVEEVILWNKLVE